MTLTLSRIPAMTDTFDDGQQIRLFESGSIMQYLVATYDKDYKISFPYGSREHWEMNVCFPCNVLSSLRSSRNGPG